MSRPKLRVCVGGEGPNDIGRPGQHDGAVQVLLHKFGDDRFEITHSCQWKMIRKFAAGKGRSAEHRNVLGLELYAREAKCDAVVFVRDRDGDSDREKAVRAGISEVSADPRARRVVGGVAREALEAWVLAAMGESGSEVHTHPKRALEEAHGIALTEEKTKVFEQFDERRLPRDAKSFRAFITEVRQLATRDVA